MLFLVFYLKLHTSSLSNWLFRRNRNWCYMADQESFQTSKSHIKTSKESRDQYNPQRYPLYIVQVHYFHLIWESVLISIPPIWYGGFLWVFAKWNRVSIDEEIVLYRLSLVFSVILEFLRNLQLVQDQIESPFSLKYI